MILVTGGYGFIGSCLAAALCREGRRVALCDRFGDRPSKWRNLQSLGGCPLITPGEAENFIFSNSGQIEGVVHLGAISSTTATDADAILENNVKFTLRLRDVCGQFGIRFVYASSASVYGDGSLGFSDDASVERLDMLRPLNLYGWSKLTADRLIFADGTDQNVAALRFFNVYGPNEYHKEGQASVMWQFFRQIAESDKVRLFRPAKPGIEYDGIRRDFVYVGDVVKVIVWMLDHGDARGIFNVGTATAASFADVARICGREAGTENLEIELTDMPANIREAYQYYTCADLTRLRAAGYDAPFRDIAAGIKEYYQEYLYKDKYI